MYTIEKNTVGNVIVTKGYRKWLFPSGTTRIRQTSPNKCVISANGDSLEIDYSEVSEPVCSSGEDLFEKLTTSFFFNLDRVHILTFPIPLSGVTDNKFVLVGEERVISAGLTGDYSTVVGFGNQHVALEIESLTGTGTATITGIAIAETNGIPTKGYQEIIAIEELANYQSTKKWLQVDSVVFSAGITGIAYDLASVGYFDMFNKKWKITAVRADLKTQSATSDFRLTLIKISDVGDKRHVHTIIEDYGHDSTSSNGDFLDFLRTDANDRSVSLDANLMDNNGMIGYKLTDYDTYFTNSENILDGKTDSGLIIRFTGAPAGGLSGIDHITLMLEYVYM